MSFTRRARSAAPAVEAPVSVSPSEQAVLPTPQGLASDTPLLDQIDLTEDVGAPDWAEDDAPQRFDFHAHLRALWQRPAGSEPTNRDDEALGAGAVDPAEALRAERSAVHAQAIAEGHTDVLDAAIGAAALSDAPHASYTDDPLRPRDRRAAILRGDIGALPTLDCVQFTATALSRAGEDLRQPVHEPGSGLQVVYGDARGPRVVDAYMLVLVQTEATHAWMQATTGAAERVTAGSERAIALGAEHLTHDFLYVPGGSFVAEPVTEGASFGAGAVASASGGLEVADADRKPGDLQQVLETRDGAWSGRGHSGTVHTVDGTGVAWLGAPDSPELVGYDGPPLEPGWYEVPADAPYRWRVGPETAPDRVATLQASALRLIDANTRGPDEDASRVGAFREDTPYSATGRSRVVSSGRLPSSDWFAWVPAPGVTGRPLPGAKR